MSRLVAAAFVSAGMMPAGGCFLCCVAAGSRVRTPEGTRAIEDLRVGDAVVSVEPATGERETSRITAIRSARRECVRLGLDDGRALTVTSDHPVYDPDAEGYFTAGDWALGRRRRLLVLTSAGVVPVEVASHTAYAGVHTVFDLTVDSPLHNFVAEDVVVHNKSIADNEPYPFGSDTGTTGDTSALDVPPDATPDCNGRCRAVTTCDDEYATVDECLANCSSQREKWAEHGDACLDAYAVNGTCLGTLSCAEYQEYLEPTTPDYPCVDTFMEFVDACFFGGAGPSAECEAYCDTALPCIDPPSVDRPLCLKSCGESFYDAAEVGDACTAAVADQYACGTALDCTGFAEWAAKSGDYPCRAEDEAVAAACN